MMFSEEDVAIQQERIWFADAVQQRATKFGSFHRVVGIQKSRDERGFAIALLIGSVSIPVAWTWVWANSPQGRKLKSVFSNDYSQLGALEGTEKDKRGILRSFVDDESPNFSWIHVKEGSVFFGEMTT